MNHKMVVGVCCAVLLMALGTLWFELKPASIPTPGPETIGLQSGLGQVMAETTAKAVHGQARVIVFTASTPDQLKDRSNHLWDTFTSELQKHNISFTVVDRVVQNAWNSGSMSADRATFKDLLEQKADADALVFFVDLPEWGRVQEAFPQYHGPKIIALDNLQQRVKPRYSGYFESGILAALITARTGPAPSAQPQTSHDWFDKYYQIYTPENYDLMP